MTSITRECRGRPLSFVALPMGKDYAISVFGGDAPHVGGVALAWRDAAGEGGIASVTAPQHRDAELAAEIAGFVRDRSGVSVSVSCGIHYERATRDEIEAICQAVREMAAEFVAGLSS